MRRLIKRLGIALGAVLLLLVAIAMATPETERSRAYAQFGFAWSQVWPFSRGLYIPMRFAPWLKKTGIAGPVRVEVEPGLSFLLDPGDVIERRILAKGIWREEIWDWVSASLQPGGTAIDVGAHIGDIALRAAKAVGPSGMVIAIEPHPVLAARLRENAAASRLPNVRVWETACGDDSRRAVFYEGPSINLGASSLSRQNVIEHEGSGTVEFEVDLVTLDHIVESSHLARLEVIKIDVQGAELNVLRGATNTIRRFRPTLIVEMVDGRLRNMGASVEMLEAFLRQQGYEKVHEGGTDAVFRSSPGSTVEAPRSRLTNWRLRGLFRDGRDAGAEWVEYRAARNLHQWSAKLFGGP